MALKTCQFCSTKVSEFTDICPRCDMAFHFDSDSNKREKIYKIYILWSRASRSYLKQLLLQSLLTPSFWIGFFFACLTLFSLVIHWTVIDLRGIPAIVLSKYHVYRDWIFSPLNQLFSLEVPDWLKDMISFYVFMGFTNLRSYQLSLDTFDIHSLQQRPHWPRLVALWPVTIYSYYQNWKAGGIFNHTVHRTENKMGYDETAVRINVFLGHAKLIPTLLLLEFILILLAVAWGTVPAQ